MIKTEKTVILLKTIAMIAGFAIILWSLGLPSLRFADAASITTVSDTLSDSAPLASSTHTIVFTTPSGVAAGESIVIDFNGNFNPSALDFGDIDLASTTDYTLVADGAEAGQQWGVLTDATSITLTSASAVLLPNATVTIQIGTNATFGTTGNTDIVNPAAEASYPIDISAGTLDSGTTRVVILSNVLVTATVNTVFTFAVSGLGGGATVNGVTLTGTSSSTSIPFGVLEDGIATTSGQLLTVNTNATNGYVVTVQVDSPLQSSTGADIDGFNQGSYTDTPTTWVVPAGTLGSENTYGHWGITSDDATTTRSAPDEFGPSEFASASTTPRVVMSHDGPANGATAGTGVGVTRVGYQVEITQLQEAGEDYETTLTYIATPTF